MNAIRFSSYVFYAVLIAAMLFAGMPAMAAVGAVVLADGGVATIEELAAEFSKKNKELADTSAEIKTALASFEEKLKANQVNDEVRKLVDDLLFKHNTLRAEVLDLEQRGAKITELPENNQKTWGQQFVAADGVSDKITGKAQGRFACSVKAVNSVAAGGMIRSMRETEITGLLRERRVMRDLLPTVPVNTSSVDYTVQTTRTNNAATVAEEAAKPYSEYLWDTETVNVRVIAHLTKITRQAMDDAPRLVGEIDGEMRYGLGYVEERQFLYGNNTGQNLHGIVPQATAFAKPAGYVDTNATRIDVLRLAMLQIANALLSADGIVVHETDWAMIELAKDTTGRYIVGNPQGVARPTMWGLPVIVSPAMVEGDFLVGAFRMGATIYDRMAVEVVISTENTDDFEKNMATMRAEERVALAVKRPAAFVTGTFATAITAIQTA